MKVIKNVLEAYSDHLELPLLLADLNGEINYKVNGKNSLLNIHEPTSYLSEFKQVSLQLNKPTIMSVLCELSKSSIFYIVTPVFKIKNANVFLAAGPFLVESTKTKKNVILDEAVLHVFNNEQIEERLNKMEHLHLLLLNLEKVEKRFLIPEQFIDLLQTLDDDLNYELLDYEAYIVCILNEFINIGAFSFIGIALKNKDDIFVVKHFRGEKVKNLEEKRFYIGEGLLGKAAITGEDFYWSKATDTQRGEFLNRYGIFPNQLFGYTLKQGDNVSGIIFGGSFKEEVINENLLKLVKYIINFVYQKKNVNNKLLDSWYCQYFCVNDDSPIQGSSSRVYSIVLVRSVDLSV